MKSLIEEAAMTQKLSDDFAFNEKILWRRNEASEREP